MRLAADANVLLSALIGGRAKLVLSHAGIQEILTVPSVLDEVHQYLSELARKRRLPVDVLLLALAALPVTVVEREHFAGRVKEAGERIGRRDPDDVDLVALALHAGVSIWSNDRDFENVGVEVYPTARLLKKLGVGR